MKVLIQWASLTPQDWVEIDSRDWVVLPKSPVPSGETLLTITNEKKYINAINIQGVILSSYDHYAITHVDGVDINLICWDDDLEDHEGDFKAVVWLFQEPAYDEKVKTINTRQSWMGYYQSNMRRLNLISKNIDILAYVGKWGEFLKPASFITLHGIWMSNELYEKHKSSRRQVGWREWV